MTIIIIGYSYLCFNLCNVHFYTGFLLPILQLLTKHSVVEKENPIPIPVPSSLVLVPTPHLAHQVSQKKNSGSRVAHFFHSNTTVQDQFHFIFLGLTALRLGHS